MQLCSKIQMFFFSMCSFVQLDKAISLLLSMNEKMDAMVEWQEETNEEI